MDGMRGEEACEREEVMCKHSHERGVRSAHFGHCLFFLFWSDPFSSLNFETGERDSCLMI